jgi:hypothetical protein
LKKHLKPLQQRDLIDVWYDGDISAGTEWAREITEHLNKAQIILLLVIPAFMDSEYCYSIEMRLAIERHERGEARVIPIILRPVIWNEAPFGKLQILPTDAKPVSSKFWDTKDDAYVDIARGIQKMTQELRIRLQNEAPTTQQAQSILKNPPESNTATDADSSTIVKSLQFLTEHRECAWVRPWDWGEAIANVELKYNSQPDADEYESAMPESVRQTLDEWCMEKENQTKANNLKREPAGLQVRLEKVEWHHSTFEEGVATPQFKHFIWLSPTKYLYYFAIHRCLGSPQLKSLREKHFSNAFLGLKKSLFLDLPSNFALHMAVVSQDKHLLLRRRLPSPMTELYPSAWEAGIGEFMHGPVYKRHSEYPDGPFKDQYLHFKNGIPDLFWFLRNAVAEELGYREARQKDFRLYGFAVEYETLAPKLLVVYNSDLSIDELLKKAERAADHARELDKVKLEPNAIASICSRYSSWGPTSKLVMLLALKQDLELQNKGDWDTEVEELKNITNVFDLGDKPTDDWKMHKQQ